MDLKLNASQREVTKKRVKQLRNQKILPAAIYGYNGNKNIQLPLEEFTVAFKKVGYTGLVDLSLDGGTHTVLIDEVQINPVTRDFTHASLREVRMDQEINSDVPFELIGDEVSPAVKEEQSLVVLTQNTIELSGLPRALPQKLEIDVSGFHAGDTLLMKDIKLPAGVELVRSEDEEIVIVTTTSAIQKEIIEDVNAAIAEAVATETPEGATGEAQASDAKPADSADKKEE